MARVASSLAAYRRVRVTSALTAVAVGLAVFGLPVVAGPAALPAAAAVDAAYEVTVSADRAQVDATNPTTTFTLTPSRAVGSPYYLSVYDDTGRQVYACTGPGYACQDGRAVTFTATTPNNASRTYTAYVAQDKPLTGPPANDVRGTSSVSVANLGWTGVLTLAADRPVVDANAPTTMFTLTRTKSIPSPYNLSVYDDTGRKVYSCTWQSTPCTTSAPITFTATTPNNATRTYTAYVSQDLPLTGPPTNDVRSPVSVVVANQGWTGSIALVADSPYVDANNLTTTFTLTRTSSIPSPYNLSVYDDTGRKVYSCTWQSTPCTTSTPITFTATTPNNATRTYTAYLSQDLPLTGPPTNDVRGASSATVASQGWTGVLTLSADRTQVDANNPTTTFTLTASRAVPSPYLLSVYDDTGRKVYACPGWNYGCANGGPVTFSVGTANNATRTYTAYVAQDQPTTGPPTNDVRSPASIVVRNAGWIGTLSLVQTSATPTSRSFTVTPSKPVASPYYLSAYDETGQMVLYCPGWNYGCASGNPVTFTLGTANNATHIYTAYVAQDEPSIGPPRIDVRAASGVYSTPDRGPTGAGETASGSNPSEACSQRCHGDPVNSVTGEFWENTTDLSLPGAGPSLTWTRAYGVTRASVAGSQGWGWTSSFDMRLSMAVGATGSTLDTASTVQVIQENGSVISFARLSNGSYVAPSRTFATLQRQADGTFVLTRRNTQIFVFDASGRLISEADRNGNQLTLSYDSAGHLTHVLDGHSRSLSVVWSGALVSAVTDQDGRTVSYGYSVAGDLVSVTYPNGSSVTYLYDTAHRITSMTGPVGGVTSNAYDGQGRVIKQTDPLERVTTFAYGDGQTTITDPTGAVTIERYVDGQVLSETHAAGTTLEATTYYTYGPTNQVSSTTDALGRVTRFTYDAYGNRTSVTDPLGRVSTTTYDEFNNPLIVTNPGGDVTRFAYDARGNLTSSTDPTGATTSYTLNPDGSIATVTDALGQLTSLTYDAYGFVSSTTAPNGSVMTSTYDKAGNKLSVTSPAGNLPGADPAAHRTTYTYDAMGLQLTATDALGEIVTRAYDAAGRLVASTDPTGATSTSSYDAAGQLSSVTDATGARTTFTYDGGGRLTSTTDPAGATTSTTYDVLGRVVTRTDATGRMTHLEYDAGNRLAASVAPSGARMTYAYDAADELVSTTDPLGHVTSTTYDAAGRPVTVTDADGRSVTTSYDKAGRTTQLRRADGSTLTWTYDAAGQITSTTDPAGQDATYAWTANGQQAGYTDTAGRATTYGYDVDGNRTSLTQPDGSVTSYAFDALGRTTGIDYSDATADVATNYDAAGRVSQVVDGTGTTTYTRDLLGRVTAVARATGTVGYGYDAVGRITSLTYPDGSQVDRGYDAAGRLTTVTDWANRAFTYEYDTDGNVAQLSYPNGVSTNYAHDAAGKTLGITTTDATGQQLLDLAYGYTDAGLLSDQTTSRPGAPRAPPATGDTTAASSFTWDPLGRLAQVTGANAGTLTYDTTGAVTALPDGRTLTYDAAHQLTGLTNPAANATTAYTYDARGNRTSTTTSTTDGDVASQLTWNQANELTSITAPEATSTYGYDAAGLRTSATTTDAAGTSTESFTWDTISATAAQLLTDATFTYVYGLSAAPLEQVGADGQVDYLHTDLLGSVRSTTDATGAITADTDNDTYGRIIPAADGSKPQVSQVTRFGYAGEYTDPTGYLYLRARYYDPGSAQFLSVDPLLQATRDAYGYTSGNPLQFTDPLGLSWYNPLSWSTQTLDNISDGVAGFGDALTFGGTKQIRRLLNYDLNGDMNDVANSCTAAYAWGSTTGLVAVTVATAGGAGAAAGGARAAGEAAGEGAAEASRIGDAAATVRRFVRQDEFDAVEKAIANGDSNVQVGRFFTPDSISDPGIAAEQLALPGTKANPLVGYFDVPASALPSEPLATFGPRLVRPEFSMPGGGLEIEVSELYGRPLVSTVGLNLVRF